MRKGESTREGEGKGRRNHEDTAMGPVVSGGRTRGLGWVLARSKLLRGLKPEEQVVFEDLKKGVGRERTGDALNGARKNGQRLFIVNLRYQKEKRGGKSKTR